MFNIGCDPEFVITNNGEFIRAYEIIPNEHAFGLDGNENIGEMRPPPAYNSFTLIANIKKTLKEGIEKVPVLKKKYDLLAGHFKCGRPIGGHIHISSPDIKSRMFDSLYNAINPVILTLSDVIDDLTEREKRWDTGYGCGWREADHRGFEYRTPGSWLINPKVAFVYLFVTETAVKEFLEENSKIFKKFLDKKENSEREAVLNFISSSKSNDYKTKKIANRIIESVFSTPVDWGKSFKEEWL